jgi:hypothetical protein
MFLAFKYEIRMPPRRFGLGYAKAVELGRKGADCDNPSNPEFSFKGLSGATRRQVKLALNEWPAMSVPDSCHVALATLVFVIESTSPVAGRGGRPSAVRCQFPRKQV